MYAEWASLQTAIQTDPGNTSVLNIFPQTVGKDVACAVVKSMSQALSIGVNSNNADNTNRLMSEKDVKWTMEVICYGLSLPLEEHEALRDCVNIYCEWLTALNPQPKSSVPAVLLQEPNDYIQLMFKHLYNVFIPRPKSGIDLVKRQALLCHRVLRHVQLLATESMRNLSRGSWEAMLKFLLAITDTLMAPPKEKDDIGDQIGERVINVLFELWLLSCAHCFPIPSLWKTFRAMSLNWRHHDALVSQWHRINTILTSQLLKDRFGTDYPELQVSDEDGAILPTSMTQDQVIQSWFRFLHIISNPVDLSNIQIISQTPKFLHMALTSEVVIDPAQHNCLRSLPQIFFKAMKSVSILVDAFLGVSQNTVKDDMSFLSSMASSTSMSVRSSMPSINSGGSTPPERRKAKAFSVSGKHKLVHSRSSVSARSDSFSSENLTPYHLTLDSLPVLAAKRPKCNSILHMFGAWLFDGALLGVKVHGEDDMGTSRVRSSSFVDGQDRSQSVITSSSHISANKNSANEAGRAEACGALCRIFCAKKTDESILPVYLARFYIALYHALDVSENQSGPALASVLFNSIDLLRLDLDGVLVLVPRLLDAMEVVLSDTSPKIRYHDQIPLIELRKSAIHLLLSMLCLPLHFKSLTIKDIVKSQDDTTQEPVTVISLRVRITELLLKALLVEVDPMNTQMLLGGLTLLVQDLSVFEEMEKAALSNQDPLADTTTYSVTQPAGLDKDRADSEASVKMTQSESPRSAVSVGSTSSGPDLTTEPETHHQIKARDTAHGLFGQAASVVSNRLMASWKLDLNIALAAIEVILGLSKVKLNPHNSLMCKRTIKWMCDFIVYQCSRPAPSHSKDLHSMIVAAFHCLMSWLVDHHYLLQDKECLHTVLEVVELGISGSKSQNRASDPPKFKAEKDLMPASERVKHAAEAVLDIIIDHVGMFPPPCGPESTCSLLDEDTLLKMPAGYIVPEQQPAKFRYFVLENAIIIGILEKSVNSEDTLPSLTALIRGPFGRHAWSMQLRHLAKSHQNSLTVVNKDPGRPVPDDNIGVHHNITHRHFPEVVDAIPKTKSESSIPSLGQVIDENNLRQEHDKILSFIGAQVDFENKMAAKHKTDREKSPFPNPKVDCKAPSLCDEFQTARLFLSHYGFLTLEALKEPTTASLPPSLVMLNSGNESLSSDLDALDRIPTRSNDTAFVFYVKTKQTAAHSIINNVTSSANVQPQFLAFVQSLGWPIDVHRHAGWTGHMTSSWRTTQEDTPEPYAAGTGGSIYDGRRQVLYWADVSTEIAFVIPSPYMYHLTPQVIPSARPSVDDKLSQIPPPKPPRLADTNAGPPRLADTNAGKSQKPTKSLSLDLPQVPRVETTAPSTPPIDVSSMRKKSSTLPLSPDIKIMIVWLEAWEDHSKFPVDDLLYLTITGQEAATSKLTEKDVHIIFIHSLKSGLYRVHMKGQSGRASLAIPLVDGMVVSERSLGTLVRQTVINICKRRRLESDQYQPPHVKRKHKIQNIVSKYRRKLSEPDFFTALLKPPT